MSASYRTGAKLQVQALSGSRDNGQLIFEGSAKKGRYAIVLFNDENRSGKSIVELVPTSWLIELEDDKQECFYPPEEDMRVTKYIEQAKPPGSTWKRYDVNIMKMADNYDQGLRRLNRACIDMKIETSAPSSGETTADQDSISEESSDEDTGEVSSTTSSPRPRQSVNKRASKCINEDTTHAEHVEIPKNSETKMIRSSQGNPPAKKRKRDIAAESHDSSAEFSDVAAGFKAIHQRLDKIEETLSKQILSTKLSIVHDIKKRVSDLKNTIVLNRPPGVGDTLKQCKTTLGTPLPIPDVEAFQLFEATIVAENEKEKALKQIMAESAGTAANAKDAVRRILGDLIMKAVQEAYSGTGKKGPNGVTKKNFSSTNTYACMKDVIVDKLHVDKALVLTATSRYLSGAGDREGGKARRDARKAGN